MASFRVVIDTREKKPLELESGRVIAKEVRKLDTGDYSIVGMEEILCIERKASVAEVAQNIHQQAFLNEMKRSEKYPYAFLILEFSMKELLNFPHLSDLPPAVKKRIRVGGKYLLTKLNELQVKHGINIIYAGCKKYAEMIVVDLMEEVYKLHANN